MANETPLALTGGSTNITNASQLCSAGLWKLLSAGDDGGASARLIAINRTLRQEAETVYPALVRQFEPADPMQLMGLLIKHAASFGIQAKSDAEWASILEVYLEALEKLPISSVEEAFARWHRAEMYPKDPGRHAFMPRPAELHTLAQPSYLTLAKATHRAKKALEHIAKTSRPELTPEERQANVEAAREVMEALKARAAQIAPEAPKPASAPLSGLAKTLIEEGLRGKPRDLLDDIL